MTDDVRREIEWEHSAVERGVRRYRASLMRNRNDGGQEIRELAELEPGQEIMRQVVGPAHKALEAAVLEARDGFGKLRRGGRKGGGRFALWWAPILSLEPDTLAVIGVRSMLATRMHHARPLRSVALEIGRNAQTQREFELWRAAENAKARKGREAGTWVPDYWRLMRELAPELTERAFRKWSKKSERLDRLEWSREERLHLGVKVTHVIVGAVPEWFEITMPGYITQHRYRTERIVALTQTAREWVVARHTFNEMRRPLLVPTLVAPKDWTRVQQQEKLDEPV